MTSAISNLQNYASRMPNWKKSSCIFCRVILCYFLKGVCFYFICVNICLHANMYMMCMSNSGHTVEEGIGSLGTEFQVTLTHHVSVVNESWVLYKSNQCWYLLSCLSGPWVHPCLSLMLMHQRSQRNDFRFWNVTYNSKVKPHIYKEAYNQSEALMNLQTLRNWKFTCLTN